MPQPPQARIAARAQLPTPFGQFELIAFETADQQDHVALVRGDPGPDQPVLVRIHSQCLTGDVFQSLRCDCHGQLEAALQSLGEAPQAILLYLRQEGRGIGLSNKIRAYALQEQGADTVEANEALGFDADLRDYGVGVAMLKCLGVRSVRLMTNNPAKVKGLEEHGIRVVEVIPLTTPPTPINEGYLNTKHERLGHRLKG